MKMMNMRQLSGASWLLCAMIASALLWQTRIPKTHSVDKENNLRRTSHRITIERREKMVSKTPHKEVPRYTIRECQPSSTGERLAIEVTDQAHLTKLYLVELRPRTGLKRIVASASYAAWSPDDTYVVYSEQTGQLIGDDTKAAKLAIFRWSDSSTLDISEKTGYIDRHAAWRKDGKAIVFTRLHFRKGSLPKTHLECVYALGTMLKNPRPVGSPYVGIDRPLWSPSRHQIGYIALTPGAAIRGLAPLKNDLYLLDVDTSRVTRITRTGRVQRYWWDWSPDGRYVVYAATNNRGLLDSLRVVDVVNGTDRAILQSKAFGVKQAPYLESLSWSPAGGYILLGVRRWPPTRYDVARLEYPTGRLTWLTRDGNNRQPRWLKSGAMIVYVRGDDEVWEMLRDGSHKRRLISLADVLL